MSGRECFQAHAHNKADHEFLFLKDFIYLFMRDTERGAETQAEGEAGSQWGA